MDSLLIKIAAMPINREAIIAISRYIFKSEKPGLIIVKAPTIENSIAKNLLFLIFSFKKIIAQSAPKIGAVKFIAVASAKGIFEIEKNHKYIAATAKVDLTSCNLIEFVLRLGRPVLSIQGKIKTIAKKDLKKII